MKSLGLCVGASAVSYALIDKSDENTEVVCHGSVTHDGNPRAIISRLMAEPSLCRADRLAVTGRKFRQLLNASSIAEVEAIEKAYGLYKTELEPVQTVVSAGGETFMAYRLDPKGRVIDVRTGSKCASGTGEFFLQQIKRMNLSIDEACLAATDADAYRVSGRCSVFCKSDCTHALNKGTPKSRVVSGLCEMMALKIVELLSGFDHGHVLLCGGVSRNTAVVRFLRERVENLTIPEYGASFEALGAALWAVDHDALPIDAKKGMFSDNESSMAFLPGLRDYVGSVTFGPSVRRQASPGDICILGLDVGSTTTKAVLVRQEDKAIVASCYLRTNGDPIGASRQCYAELLRQVPSGIAIVGLGTTGSGRQIAGLHALTPAVINEIIAHAAASVHFDAEVNTIFEIGGQDAKYTYITNGVPSDYAMNEACSAGTGSFLEEAAKESLNLPVTEIGPMAMQSDRAPNFSDQCAAFINSDIKAAIQEGVGLDAICAGLVYSICMNYVNRVKGSRPVGDKVFMQGGVCYNPAVPVAMAALTGRHIIVPPDPGLMGAFGVALEVAKRLSLGMLKPGRYDMAELAGREAIYHESFVCAGGAEECDRKCAINRIGISGRVYPFGGACNKYTGLLKGAPATPGADLVKIRENLVFSKYSTARAARLCEDSGKTIGILPSLLTSTLYPLYYNFFTGIGYRVVLEGEVLVEGLEQKGAPFCYPAEISHGYMASLIRQKPDVYFLPHVRSMPVAGHLKSNQTCPFVQAEPYFLKASFPELSASRVLSPVLRLEKGLEQCRSRFVQIGRQLGVCASLAGSAFTLAVKAQQEMFEEFRALGRQALEEMDQHPDQISIVLFGRPYNAFSKNGNMAIPHKFASRGYRVIPLDFLPPGGEESQENMYWPLGHTILQASMFVKKHPRLFGAFITNFSCGPDSFLLSYFRREMGAKPSLTLEIDSHTADVGLDTRIEAFLDVVGNFLEIDRSRALAVATDTYEPARVIESSTGLVIKDSYGKARSLRDPKVKVVVPSMGQLGSRLLVSSLRYTGISAIALPAPTRDALRLGQSCATCKECLPLLLTLGSILKHAQQHEDTGNVYAYFMPKACGPCRFGQYSVLGQQVIAQKRIRNAAMLSLSDENGYAGLGTAFTLRAWQALTIDDVLLDIYAALLALAESPESALCTFDEVADRIVGAVSGSAWGDLLEELSRAAHRLSQIPLKRPLSGAPSVALVGEIYVRRDEFSRQGILEFIAGKGIVVKTAPIAEWVYYADHMIQQPEITGASVGTRLSTLLKVKVKQHIEWAIKRRLARSGLYAAHLIDVPGTLAKVSHLISPHLEGEAILTTGLAVTSIVEEVDGVLSIGPFGCMPSRIAEAVTSKRIGEAKIQTASQKDFVERVLEEYPSVPFLPIETDGNQFTQSVLARLEAFCLQAIRIHETGLRIRRGEAI